MLNGPLLVTERLILRPPAAEDFEPWAASMADEETMRFIGGVSHRSVAWRTLTSVAGAWHISGFSMFSVIERSSGRWVGRLGPWRPDSWPGNEIGWAVASEFAGLGYAHEGAVAAMDFAFDQLGWSEVLHCIHPDNHRSVKLAERLGSRNTGPTSMPPPYERDPVDAWRQTAAEWRARAR